MALVSTRGMVFRTVKYSENSIICDILTESHGLRSFIVSSSKNNRSMTNLMQIMNILDLVFYEKQSEKVQRIKECHLHHFYNKIPTDFRRSSIGIFMLEVSRNTIREQEEHPELFDFLLQWFVGLDEIKDNLQHYHLSFLLELARYGGFYPHLPPKLADDAYFDMLSGAFVPEFMDPRYVLNNKESQMVATMLRSHESHEGIQGFNLMERNQLLDTLLRYYQLHVPGFSRIRSLEIVREVMK